MKILRCMAAYLVAGLRLHPMSNPGGRGNQWVGELVTVPVSVVGYAVVAGVSAACSAGRTCSGMGVARREVRSM
jgi:hypothetical protein